MKINCGIIGLPNVGKSTLFSLLTNISVRIKNFPFSTIHPNIAIVEIPDERLLQMNRIVQSKSVVSGTIKFIDIAGLIKGASKGEGLGNKILNNIKTATIICHVVRCFDNNLIMHIKGYLDPKRDVSIINEELILFDIMQCEKNIASLQKDHINNIDVNQTLYCLRNCLNNLYAGKMLRMIQFSKTEIEKIRKFDFLTLKPVIYVANVDKKYKSNVYFKKLKEIGFYENIPVIPYFVYNNKITSFLKNDKNILHNIINNIVFILRLNTFFTVNTNMIRSWICLKGTTALDAAYKVHSDFKKGFIRAQIIKFNDFLENQGEIGVKKSGKIHFKGKNYIVEDGDIIKFLFYNNKQPNKTNRSLLV